MGGCLSSSNDGGSMRGDSTDGTLGSSKKLSLKISARVDDSFSSFMSSFMFLVLNGLVCSHCVCVVTVESSPCHDHVCCHLLYGVFPVNGTILQITLIIS